MIPIYNFEIEQGGEYQVVFGYNSGPISSYTPIDITGYTARLQILLTTPIEWSTANGIITIPLPADGKFHVYVPNTDTVQYDFVQAPYEFEITPSGGSARRLFRGTVTLRPQLVSEGTVTVPITPTTVWGNGDNSLTLTGDATLGYFDDYIFLNPGVGEEINCTFPDASIITGGVKIYHVYLIGAGTAVLKNTSIGDIIITTTPGFLTVVSSGATWIVG